jgi:hypothetical protein
MKPVDSTQEHSRREFFDRARSRAAKAVETKSKAPTRHKLAERATHMRVAGRPRGSASNKALPTPPPAAIIALNRLGFGPRPGDIAAFNGPAGNDPQRL